VLSRLQDLRHEVRPVLRLAIPLALAELGWVAMGVVDTLMVGRLPDSAVAIGSVSLGTMFFYTVAVLAGALFMGLDTLVSQAYGARRFDECHRALWSALYFLIALVPTVMAVIWLAVQSLEWFGVNPAVRPGAMAYTSILNFGTPALMLYFALRRYLQGMARVRIVTFALVSANIINLIGNWALINGHLGFRAMGTDGSAWATVASRYYMAFCLVAYTLYIEYRHSHGIFDVPIRPDFPRLRRLLALGGPAALHVGLEMGIFGLATVLIARLNPESLAAHQIALNLASVTFMIPLGISSAAAVRVGHRIGAGDPEGAGRSGSVAILIGAAFMGCAAIAFLLFPAWIARWYTSDPVVIGMSVVLLAIAAVFQLFDGVQIISSGALRGAGDTRTPMFCNLVFYWIVGLPFSWLFGFRLGFGAAGIWSGLCLGLILIGTTLVIVWRRRVRILRERQIPAAI